MKKIFTLLTVSAIALASFTSCNKKLKDDMRDLENSLSDQERRNNDLQGQLNGLKEGITKEPLMVKFNTTDNDDQAVSYEGDYTLVVGSDYTNSYVEDNGGGTYDVYVRRSDDLGTDYSAEIQFTYNPSNGQVTAISAQTQGFGSEGEPINVSFSGSTGLIQTVSVSAFDFNAGTITFSYSANSTVNYFDNAYTGNTMSFTASYTGTLVKYYNGNTAN